MTFASGAFGQLRYIQETTAGVTPVVGNAVNLRTTTPGMKASTSTVRSREISSTRMISSTTNADLNVDGTFDFELSGREYDPFIQGVLYSSFNHYGVSGLGASFTITSTISTITASVAPVGASAFTNLSQGSWFKVVPPSGATTAVKDYFADAWFKVSLTTAPTPTEITVDASTPLRAPGLLVAAAGYLITQSVVSNGNSIRTFSFEWDQDDINTNLTFTGMQPDMMSLDLAVGSIITGQFGFTGRGHTIQNSSLLPGSPMPSQDLEIMNAVTDIGVVRENGANLVGVNDFIKSAKLEVKNNLRAQKALAVYGTASVGVGELMVSGSLEVYFESATYYRKWLNGTNTSLEIGVADPSGNGYLIELDKVRFVDGSLSPPDKDSDVILTLPFEAYYNAGTGRGIRITRAVAA